MVNLKNDPMIADEVSVAYDGPGYYSAVKTSRPLSDPITLIKVAEEYVDKDDVYQFCRQNGYMVKPYKINCCSDVPSNWEVIGCNEVPEYEEDNNY